MTEDIFKGRKKMKRQLKELRQLHESGHTDFSAPGLAQAEGFCDEMHNDDVARADEFKSMSHAVPTVTSDIGQRYQPDHSHPAPRDPAGNLRTAPRAAGKRTHPVGAEAAIPVSSSDGDYAGHAMLATTAGDVGSRHFPVPGEDPAAVKALGTPSGNPLAYALRYLQEQASKSGSTGQDGSSIPSGQMEVATGHPVRGYPDGSNRRETSQGLDYRHQGHDLRESGTFFNAVIASLRTARGNVVDLGISDSTPGGFSHEGTANVSLYDAASPAGSMTGVHGNDVLDSVQHSPYRPDSHQSRTSAPNGGHSVQGSVVSTAVRGKASKMDIMKECLREQGAFGNA